MTHALRRKPIYRDLPSHLSNTPETGDLRRELDGLMAGSSLNDSLQGYAAHQVSELDRRLSNLVKEVGQITRALNGEIAEKNSEPKSAPGAVGGVLSTAKQVKAIIRDRRSRSKYFRCDLFADPAWDILLDLTRAELEGQRISVSSLCGAAAVPATTALRWITTLTDEGLLARRLDPLDGRRQFVELTESASSSMQQYLSDVASGMAAVI